MRRRTGKIRSYEIGDLVRVKVKSGWSTPVVIRDLNTDTHTVTVCLNNGLTKRHFDEITPYFDPYAVSDEDSIDPDVNPRPGTSKDQE